MDQSIKTCCTCKTAKPLGDFNKYAKADDGRQPRCRECQREKRVAWYEANREREISKSRAWSAANYERVRELDRARYWRDIEKRRQANRRYREQNGDSIKAQKREARASNLAQLRERERTWRSDNKQSIADRKRQYRITNPNVKWSETAKYHRRRAAMANGPSGREIQSKMAYYGFVCWICGDHGDTVDHVKPLAAGGLHALSNLRPACRFCNTKKRDRWYGVARLSELSSWVKDKVA